MPDVFCPVFYHVADVSRAVSLLAGVQAAWELRLSDLSVESFDDMNVINFRQIFADREFEPGMLQLEVSLDVDGQGRGGMGKAGAGRSAVCCRQGGRSYKKCPWAQTNGSIRCLLRHVWLTAPGEGETKEGAKRMLAVLYRARCCILMSVACLDAMMVEQTCPEVVGHRMHFFSTICRGYLCVRFFLKPALSLSG